MTANTAAAAQPRIPSQEIGSLFHTRWSPRAFTGEELPLKTLMGLFEAARWAPSAMNAQPWRFVYALRGTPDFERFLSTLAPPNQLWASRASALVALVSQRFLALPGKAELAPSASHSFDAGAAWTQLALQAHLWGWATHAIGGFDQEKAREVLAIPDDHQLEVFIAVGRQGDPAGLPEWARTREQPSDRRPLEELVREGSFGAGRPPRR